MQSLPICNRSPDKRFNSGKKDFVQVPFFDAFVRREAAYPAAQNVVTSLEIQAVVQKIPGFLSHLGSVPGRAKETVKILLATTCLALRAVARKNHRTV